MPNKPDAVDGLHPCLIPNFRRQIEMKPYRRKIDTVTQGNRYDVPLLFADAECFAQLVEDLVASFQSTPLDCVAYIRRPRLHPRDCQCTPSRRGGLSRSARAASSRSKPTEMNTETASPYIHLSLFARASGHGADMQGSPGECYCSSCLTKSPNRSLLPCKGFRSALRSMRRGLRC